MSPRPQALVVLLSAVWIVAGCDDDGEGSGQQGASAPLELGGEESGREGTEPDEEPGCPANAPAGQLERPGTVHHRDVEGKVTWRREGSPHRIPRGLKIGESASLTLEPCTVVIVGDGESVRVGKGGTLIAEGAEGEPVRFDSASPEPAPGAWGGVHLHADARPQSALVHTVIEDAGGERPHGAVNVTGELALRVEHVTIRHALRHGVHLDGQSRFADGSEGLKVTASGLTEPYSAPVWFRSASQVRTLPSGEYGGNAWNEIYVDNARMRATGSWRDAGVPYRLDEGLRVGSDQGAVLTVAAGATLAFAKDTAFMVGVGKDGSVDLAGTEDSPVTLTSARPKPAAGDWVGLILGEDRSDAALGLDHVVIEHAGADPKGRITFPESETCRPSERAGIAIAERDAGPRIAHVTFRSLPQEATAILLGFRSDEATDYTADAHGNDFSEAGTECRQNRAPAEGECPEQPCL